MKPLYIGLDTSCYATSAACVNEDGIVFQKKTMLPVAFGERGLRQADGVFLHVRNLEAVAKELFASIDAGAAQAVTVSARPLDAAGSYMPVFLAGVASAASMAGALGIPLLKTSHQRGHIRAALIGNECLLDTDSFLALHLSGGTTDLLRVSMQNGCIKSVSRIGGSDDLHIGQFVDRVGVRLGLSFPAGAQLELLAGQAERRALKIAASVRGTSCSFSGPESQAQRLIIGGGAPEEIAFAVYDCMARTVGKLIDHAGAERVLLCGGVSGSLLLRSLLAKRTSASLYASACGLSGDNAVGVALLGMEGGSGSL